MLFTSAPTEQNHFSRIISLIPSQTELLSDLNLDNQVVGITKFCVHPDRWFRTKTRVGGTKNIHFEIIDTLSPDLIIANKEENVKEQIETLAEKYNVWLTDVNNLGGALNLIVDTGKVTNREKEGIQIATRIREGFDDLDKDNQNRKPISAAYFIWKDPFMVAANNTFINEMMKYCGLKNIFNDQSRYPEISLKDVRDRGCRLILLSSEPYPFKEKHYKEIMQELPGINIQLVDGEMFSWYGSHLLKSIKYFQSFKEEVNEIISKSKIF